MKVAHPSTWLITREAPVKVLLSEENLNDCTTITDEAIRTQEHLLIAYLKLVICLLLLMSQGCTEQSGPRALRLGTNIWPGYEPLYLARELGYYDNHKVRLIEYTSMTQVVRAYQNDMLDAAALTLDEAIRLSASGERSRIVLVTDISNGGDALVARGDIDSVAELKGRRIGIEHSALGFYMLWRILELNEVSKKDIVLVSLQASEHERALQEGRVDAVITYDPIRSRMLDQGAKLLFDSREIPGEIVDVLIVKEDRLKVMEPYIEHLKTGWYRAVEQLDKDPAGSARILSNRLRLPVDQVLATYKNMTLPDRQLNLRLLENGEASELYPVSKKLSMVMYSMGLINQEVETSMMFDGK